MVNKSVFGNVCDAFSEYHPDDLAIQGAPARLITVGRYDGTATGDGQRFGGRIIRPIGIFTARTGGGRLFGMNGKGKQKAEK